MSATPSRLSWASKLSPQLSDDLKQQAACIRLRISKTTVAIIETGRDLLAAKEQVDHGTFIDWLRDEVGIRARSAQLYMSAARFAEGKSETVSLLAPSTVYKL